VAAVAAEAVAAALAGTNSGTGGQGEAARGAGVPLGRQLASYRTQLSSIAASLHGGDAQPGGSPQQRPAGLLTGGAWAPGSQPLPLQPESSFSDLLPEGGSQAAAAGAGAGALGAGPSSGGPGGRASVSLDARPPALGPALASPVRVGLGMSQTPAPASGGGSGVGVPALAWQHQPPAAAAAVGSAAQWQVAGQPRRGTLGSRGSSSVGGGASSSGGGGGSGSGSGSVSQQRRGVPQTSVQVYEVAPRAASPQQLAGSYSPGPLNISPPAAAAAAGAPRGSSAGGGAAARALVFREVRASSPGGGLPPRSAAASPVAGAGAGGQAGPSSSAGGGATNPGVVRFELLQRLRRPLPGGQRR